MAEVPEVVTELSQACVRFIEQAIGVAPDGTPETLPILDHYLERLPKNGETEVLSLVIPAVGAYFGEVARRAFGDGVWTAPADDYDAWELRFRRCSLRFNPIGVAWEVSTRDSEAGGFDLDSEDRDVAAAALSRTGDVREEDYYRITIRFEVLEHVYDALTTTQRATQSATQRDDGGHDHGPN